MRFPTIRTTAAALLLSVTAGFAFAAEPVITPDNTPKTTASSKHESEQPVGDTWITTKVKSELLADSVVKGTDINVSTTNGVVTLAGVLDSQVAIDKAITLTKAIKGVTDVDTRALKLRK
jgi:hyperosmotically inducible periplasmic protein